MRLIIALFAGVMLSQPLFAAPKKKPAPVKRVKSAFEAKLLTFNQLAALPKAKREQYVRDVIKLILTMERANSHYEVADNGMSLEELKYKFATMQQWLQFLPQAEAREYQRTNQSTGSGVMLWDGSSWTCGAGYEVDLSVPGCLKLNDDGTTMFSSPELQKGKCGASMQEIPHPDPSSVKVYSGVKIQYKGCMSNAGWEKLAPERRAAILRSGPDFDPWLDPNGFMRDTLENQKGIAYGGTNGVGPAESSNSSVAGAADSTAPKASSAAATPAPTPAPSAPDAAAAAAAAPAAPPAAAEPATPAAASEEKPAVTEEDPKADKCIPEPTTCDDPSDAKAKKKREDAIARFRKTAKFDGLDANICIAGGFPSKYESARKDAGTCKPVYKWGPGHCKENEVLCNPVLFCHTAKNEQGKARPQWFCVSKKDSSGQANPQWTAACAEELQARLKKTQKYAFVYGKKDASGKVKKFTKMSEPQVAESCNPSDMKVGGFQEEWNRLVAALEQLVNVWCGKNEDFKALFCRECQIIKAQMYAMTKKATGSGCAPAADKAPEENESKTNVTPEKSGTAK
jgi:hypothetical protein